MPRTPGYFITLEGLDGCGKSTQIGLLADGLRARGHRVVTTREPGGTLVGQQIREVLLNASAEPIAPLTELALMFAARAQHIEHVIQPALRRGEMVLCDRFTDSSVAYQGYGRGVPLEAIEALEEILCRGVKPDLTLILDLDADIGMERTGARNHDARQPHTRFELEGREFFDRVRKGYLALASREPRRVRVLDARGPVEQVSAAVADAVSEFLRGGFERPVRTAEDAGGV